MCIINEHLFCINEHVIIMVQSINRAFEIVRHVAASRDGIRLQDLANLCGLKKTTVYNLAETLVSEGMLCKDGNLRYRLGELVTELHMRKGGRRDLQRTASILAELHVRFPAAEITFTELGERDIFSRLLFTAGQPGKVRFTDGMTFNPYVTVCGILYFAFTPAERLIGLQMRNPFGFMGAEVWGSQEAFQERVETARRWGWAEAPTLTDPKMIKIGVPVRFVNDDLISAITFVAPRDGFPAKDLVIKEILETAERLGQR
jgi:DNA-binding IclR family transcriptional regulator